MEKNCVNCIWHDSCVKGGINLTVCEDYDDGTDTYERTDNKTEYYNEYIEYIEDWN